jgi:hypothetical protein
MFPKRVYHQRVDAVWRNTNRQHGCGDSHFTATATVGEENSTHPTTKSRETEVEKDIRVGNASKGGGKRAAAAAAAADDDGSKS